METFTFRAASLPTFEAGMTKLAKVAVKLNVAPMTYDVIARETREESYATAFGETKVSIEYVTVAVDGTSPVLPGGWQYLGAIEHLDHGNMVHGDASELSQYRDAAANCDHCGFKRNRRKTVIVRDETGKLAQVGSACMKDFLGYHGNPEKLAWLCDASLDSLMSDIDEENERGCYGGEQGTPTDIFLAVVAACVRAHGWVPKSAYDRMPTANLALYVLGIARPHKDETELRDMIAAVTVTDRDHEEATAVREWSQSISADTDNNYLGNVRVALGGSYVLSRHFGIAASAVSARRKAEQKATDRAIVEGKRAASQFVGTVGKRETFTVTVLFVRAFDGMYGTKYLVEMEDETGNVLKTFSTGDFGYRATRGDRYVIKATVKDHETYQGKQSTMLTRVAIVTDYQTPVMPVPADADTDMF